MAKSYYSIALDYSAEEVWAVVRPFDHYAWAGVESQSIIEDDKAGDQVAAIRRVTVGDKIIRQILLAHSDLDRSYTYALCDPPPIPVRNYVATLRVAPIAETDGAFVNGGRPSTAPPTNTIAGQIISRKRDSPNGLPRSVDSCGLKTR